MFLHVYMISANISFNRIYLSAFFFFACLLFNSAKMCIKCKRTDENGRKRFRFVCGFFHSPSLSLASIFCSIYVSRSIIVHSIHRSKTRDKTLKFIDMSTINSRIIEIHGQFVYFSFNVYVGTPFESN